MRTSSGFLLTLTLLLFASSVLAPASFAQIGIPDLSNSWCEAAPGQFVITPGGGGPTLLQQGIEVHLWLRDNLDQPIPNYPFQDIWMSNIDWDLSFCQQGILADADTDEEGHTTFTGPIAGGGWTESHLTVWVAGMPIAQTPGESDWYLDLRVNSPDINADAVINIQDLSFFAEDVGTGYAFRSDYNFDGVTDLSDIALFGTWLVSESFCPSNNGDRCYTPWVALIDVDHPCVEASCASSS